jgi:hypothetical protein
MLEIPFYNSSTRKYVLAFGSLFNGLSILDNKNVPIDIPLIFAMKEKFISKHLYRSNDNSANIRESLPAMGYEFSSMTYDSIRKTNTFEHFLNGQRHMYNRVPYDFEFVLVIAARRMDDSLKIVEQILPYFTPSVTVQLQDHDILKESTNVMITLDSVSHNIETNGEFEDRRLVTWSLNFTLKGYLYRAETEVAIIRKNIISINKLNTDGDFLEGIFQYNDTLYGNPGEVDVITKIEKYPHDSFLFNAYCGSSALSII